MKLQHKQKEIFKHYGDIVQLKKFREEIAEMLTEIDLSLIDGVISDNFDNELADKLNMAEQWKQKRGAAKIEQIQHEKCDRELKRIKEL